MAAIRKVIVSPPSYSTTFTGTENPLSESGVWRTGLATGLDWTDPQKSGGVAYATMTAFDGTNYIDSIGCLSGFWANHQVQATASVSGSISGLEVELLLRYDISAHNARGYEVDITANGGLLHIVRWNGAKNSYTVIADSSTTHADGDVWVATINGSVITVTQNGTPINWTISGGGSGTSVDLQAWAVANGGSYFSSGNPGIGFWNETGSLNANFSWTDFTATSF